MVPIGDLGLGHKKTQAGRSDPLTDDGIWSYSYFCFTRTVKHPEETTKPKKRSDRRSGDNIPAVTDKEEHQEERECERKEAQSENAFAHGRSFLPQ